MNWITQNWPWMLLALGVLVVLGRGASRSRRGYGRYGDHGGSPAARGVDHGSHGRHGDDVTAQAAAPARAIDPVTRNDVSPDPTLASVYRGRIYYFKTAESLQRFEAAPEQYARQQLGYADSPSREAAAPRRHRHRGC